MCIDINKKCRRVPTLCWVHGSRPFRLPAKTRKTVSDYGRYPKNLGSQLIVETFNQTDRPVPRGISQVKTEVIEKDPFPSPST